MRSTHVAPSTKPLQKINGDHFVNDGDLDDLMDMIVQQFALCFESRIA